jgi:ElaB/YqjD/DUF883 family membrane-anchored ribosome-binding protein
MKTEAQIEKLVKELKNISHDAENLVRAGGTDVNEVAREVRRRLASVLESAREGCSELEDKARNEARAAGKLIRHNPYQTAGVAFGMGLLLGVLAATRRS